jgi:hypothetical protein
LQRAVQGPHECLFLAAEASGGGPFAFLRMRRRKRSNGAVEYGCVHQPRFVTRPLGRLLWLAVHLLCLAQCDEAVGGGEGGERHGVARQTAGGSIGLSAWESFCMHARRVCYAYACLRNACRWASQPGPVPGSICCDDIIAIFHAT